MISATGRIFLVHPPHDLPDHRDGRRIIALVHPLMCLADQDVLQRHRQHRVGMADRIRSVGRTIADRVGCVLPTATPPAHHTPTRCGRSAQSPSWRYRSPLAQLARMAGDHVHGHPGDDGLRRPDVVADRRAQPGIQCRDRRSTPRTYADQRHRRQYGVRHAAAPLDSDQRVLALCNAPLPLVAILGQFAWPPGPIL
jgi:hypothetical protein